MWNPSILYGSTKSFFITWKVYEHMHKHRHRQYIHRAGPSCKAQYTSSGSPANKRDRGRGAAHSYPAKRRPTGGGRPTSTHASLSAIPSAAGSASARREAQLAALGCFFPAAASCVSSPRSSLYSLYWLLVVLLFLNNWNVWMITARSGEQQLLSPYENLLLYDSMCIL